MNVQEAIAKAGQGGRSDGGRGAAVSGERQTAEARLRQVRHAEEKVSGSVRPRLDDRRFAELSACCGQTGGGLV